MRCSLSCRSSRYRDTCEERLFHQVTVAGGLGGLGAHASDEITYLEKRQMAKLIFMSGKMAARHMS